MITTSDDILHGKNNYDNKIMIIQEKNKQYQ